MNNLPTYPYPGFRPFEQHEANIFFGRGAHVTAMLDKFWLLNNASENKRKFIAVVGRSGSGKSSLVKAGFIPRLGTGDLSGISDWQIIDIRPDSAPYASLAQALYRNCGQKTFNTAEDIEATLKKRLKKGLDEFLKEIDFSREKGLLLLVDQFEELFRYSDGKKQEEAAADFVELLLTASRHPQIYVMITLRGEYLEYCTRFRDLPQAINEGLYLVPEMTREERCEAIKTPAKLYGDSVQGVLCTALLNDMESPSLKVYHTELPDPLSLLQHALFRAWRQAREPIDSSKTDEEESDADYSTEVTVSHYYAICDDNVLGAKPEGFPKGRLQASLVQHLEELYQALDDCQQDTTKIIFRAITEYDQNKLRAYRRPIELGKLTEIAAKHQNQLIEVIDIFRQANFFMPPPPIYDNEGRLIKDGTVLQSNTKIDISHEALLHYWPRLRAWIKEETEAAELYRTLKEDAKQWLDNKNTLWTGDKLEQACDWLELQKPNASWAKRYTKPGDVDFASVTNFLEASYADAQDKIRQQVEQERKEKAQQQREQELILEQQRLEQERILERERHERILERERHERILEQQRHGQEVALEREQRKRASMRARMQMKLGAAITAIILIATVSVVTLTLQNIARSNTAFNGVYTQAKVLSKTDYYQQASLELQRSYTSDKYIPLQKRQARDWLARFTTIQGGTEDKKPISTNIELLSIVTSPDKRYLATAGKGRHEVLIYDLVKNITLSTQKQHEKSIDALAFHPAKPWLFSGGEGQRLVRWTLAETSATADENWPVPSEIFSLCFSPDGSQLLYGGNDGKIYRVNPVSGEPQALPFTAHTQPVSALAFSPDGKWLASAGYDRQVFLWQWPTGEIQHKLRAHTAKIARLAFSPDGQRLASSDASGNIVLWNPQDGEPMDLLQGHQGRVSGLAFLPDSTQLVSGGDDLTLRLWDVKSGRTLRVFQGHKARISDLAVLPGTNTVYTSSNDRNIGEWQMALSEYQGLVSLPMPEDMSTISSIHLLPDGKHFVAGFVKGSISLYRLADGALLETYANSHDMWRVSQFAVSADGRLLASAGYDRTLKLWQIKEKTLTLKETLPHERAVISVTFLPDGRLVSGMFGGGMRVFTPGQGKYQETATLQLEDTRVDSISVDRAGKWLLASGDSPLQLWQITGSQITPAGGLLKMPPQSLWWTALSPDGRYAVATGNRQEIEVYQVTPQGLQLKTTLSGHTETVIRARFTPGGHLISAGADATIRFWDLEESGEIFTLVLPAKPRPPMPMLDFDFHCTAETCMLAVPLHDGRLSWYNMGPDRAGR